MKKKTATKIMSYLLTTAMIVGGLSLSPLTTVEVMAGDPTPKNINLNVLEFPQFYPHRPELNYVFINNFQKMPQI